MQLRPYQQQAKEAVQAEWTKGNSKTLLVLPTGTGKTIVFSKLAEDCVRDGERVLILAHRGELLDQAADKLAKSTGLGCAVEKAEQTCLDSWFRVVVGSVQSLMREDRLNRFGTDHFGTIIVDEAHHCCPAGTMVDNKPIEELAIGDYVTTFNHATGTMQKRRVLAVMSRPTDTICKVILSNGNSFCCTPDHHVWNGNQYIACNQLVTNSSMVYERIRHEGENVFSLRNCVSTAQSQFEDDTLLFNGVCDISQGETEKTCQGHLLGMRHRIRALWRKLYQANAGRTYCSKECSKKYSAQVSSKTMARTNKKYASQRMKERNPMRDDSIKAKMQNSLKGRPFKERGGNGHYTKQQQMLFDALSSQYGSGFNLEQAIPTKPVACSFQNLPTCFKVDISYSASLLAIEVDGKTHHTPAGESQGYQKDHCLEPVRVARIEIYKRGSGNQFDKLCPGGVVYNIEVDTDDNFFANGVLVHNCLSDSYQRVLNYFDQAHVLGVTATSDRGDMRNLGEYFQSLAYEYSLPQAIKDGYLSPIRAQTIPLQLDLTGVGVQAGDFKTADLGTALDPYLYQIADEMAKVCMDRKTLVFLPLIKTSQKFRDILIERGFSAAEVNGESEDRAQILADFERGKYNVLTNSALLTEGYDCPAIDCIVMLRPTKIRSLYSQCIGRGTRLCEGKDYLLLLDFLWHTERHELCHPAHLICTSEEVAKKMTENIEEAGVAVDLEEAERQAEGDVVDQREAALAKLLEEMKRRKRKLVDPLQFEMSIQAEDLASYTPAFGWEMAPASDKQKAALEKLGILPDEIDNAGKASLLLERLDKRRWQGLTTPKQIRFLEGKGLQHVGTWSFDSAKKLIDRIAANGWRTPYDIDPHTYAPTVDATTWAVNW